MRQRGLRACSLLATSVIACENAGHAAETIVYSYDSLGRLVRVERSGATNPGTSAAYSYDSADNRANVTVSVASAAASTAPQSPANIQLNPFAIDSGSQLQCTTATDDVSDSDADGDCAQAATTPDDPPPAPPSGGQPE